MPVGSSLQEPFEKGFKPRPGPRTCNKESNHLRVSSLCLKASTLEQVFLTTKRQLVTCSSSTRKRKKHRAVDVTQKNTPQTGRHPQHVPGDQGMEALPRQQMGGNLKGNFYPEDPHGFGIFLHTVTWLEFILNSWYM